MEQERCERIIQEIEKAVIGKRQAVEKVLCAILAGGHILLEDIPGVGKTTLALAFSRALSLKQNRMQFTPDVMPADVTGFSVYQKETGKFVFHPGAVMCNLFLADEINRTSPKTQSALLEVMEEGSVTVDGVTRKLEPPFVVLATQNPVGSAGTQLLPESQMDRFMIRISLGYPSAGEEMRILKDRKGSRPLDWVEPAVSAEELVKMQKEIDEIYIKNSMYEYMIELVRATRKHPLLEAGASPRGSLALSRMASARAYTQGRDYCIPEDVRFCFADTIGHRLVLSARARAGKADPRQILAQILEEIPSPKGREKSGE